MLEISANLESFFLGKGLQKAVIGLMEGLLLKVTQLVKGYVGLLEIYISEASKSRKLPGSSTFTACWNLGCGG
jgi:hypothetical protein